MFFFSTTEINSIKNYTSSFWERARACVDSLGVCGVLCGCKSDLGEQRQTECERQKQIQTDREQKTEIETERKLEETKTKGGG